MHGATALSVAFSPDGKKIAVANYQMTVQLWDLSSQQLITTLHGHSSIVNSVAFSPDGKIIATGSNDNH